MTSNVTKEDLVEMVRRLRRDEGSKEELVQMMETLKAHVVHPDVEMLVYGPDIFTTKHELTAEEVVDKALSYQPLDSSPPKD